MSRKLTLTAALGLITVFAAGCLTDYDGRAGEQTQGEAKLWGKEFAVISGTDYDGTWSKTVAYNNKAGAAAVTINNYLNPVFSSFSRDGIVDRDGDDVQGNGGDDGGKFNNGIKAVDNAKGSCEFFDNIKQDYVGDLGPAVALCITGFVEEIDSDLLLQESFASVDELLKGIWANSVGASFTVDLTSVSLNGVPVDLLNPVTFDVAHNGFRPINAAVDLTSPGGQELIQALLDNTVDRTPVDVSFSFDGGLGFGTPLYMSVAFDHESLRSALQ